MSQEQKPPHTAGLARQSLDIPDLEVSAERNRRQLLLEVSNAVNTHLNMTDVLTIVSSCLREFFNHDFATMVLRDEESGLLRVQALDAAMTGVPFSEGMVLPIEGTPTGLAITTGKPVMRERLDLNEFYAPMMRERLDLNEFYAPMMRQAYDAGVRCGCSVPLIVHDEVLGSINLGSRREGNFTNDDVDLLSQIAGPIATAVANARNFQQAKYERDRNQLLLEVNNAVAANLDLHQLLKAISQTLCKVVPHDFTGLAVYDEKIQQLRVHAVESKTEGMVGEGTPIPMAGTPVSLAFATRETVRREQLDLDEFFAPMFQTMAKTLKLRSCCAVPLVFQDCVTGVLNLTSRSEAAFSDKDARLLEQIGSQLAIAVENALNFQRAKRESDRNQVLLEVTSAVTSHLDLQSLFSAIADCLANVIGFDAAGLTLYDAESGMLRVGALSRRGGVDGPVTQGMLIPLAESPGGNALTTRQPVLVSQVDLNRFKHPMVQALVAVEGVRSGCAAPLISHEKMLGTLDLLSREPDFFNEADAELLGQIAGQIAIAVENALNFDQAQRERDRKQLLLEVNNAITTHLDLHELLLATSNCLQKIIVHDVAVLALYDLEARKLRVHTMDAPWGENIYSGEAFELSLKGSPAGQAVTTGQPVLVDRIEEGKFSSPITKRIVAAGLKSSCTVPLVSHGQTLGAVSLLSRQESAFVSNDAELLSQIASQLSIAVENSISYEQIASLKNKLASEKTYLEEEIQTEYNFAEIVGNSAALKKVLQAVATVAPTDSAVLLCGETGTGKELIARAIHNLSGRRERTLVKLNCAAIPTGLLESELFGHEKGAFTGAIAQRVGRFELAHKGTLLLDEIGEIPLELQPKLLRVLQEQEFERLGSSRTIKTDVRLIAATNVDLPQMVAEKKFRSDLFYRLNVFPITIPPLRERTGDLALLVGYFTQKHSLRMNKRINSVAKDTIDALCEYHWPGNVRELENFIERAVILTEGPELRAPLGELKVLQPAKPDESLQQTAAAVSPAPVSLEDVEREHIAEVVRRTGGVIGGKGGAAEILGLPVSTLRNRMKKLGLL